MHAEHDDPEVGPRRSAPNWSNSGLSLILRKKFTDRVNAATYGTRHLSTEAARPGP